MPTDPPDEPGVDLVVRPAGRGDLASVAEVHLRARAAAYPAMPHSVHPDDEARAWVDGWDLTEYDVWVAEASGRVVGYARFDAVWLDDLYVDPGAQGSGVGGTLLDVVKAQRPGGFGLWVFASNLAARAFYARRGLTEVEHTDGSGNQERAPDVRMVWPG